MSSLGMSGEVTVTRKHERSPLLWAGGTVFDVVLGGEASAGGFALLDQWGALGDTTPMHVHRNEAEVFYVLDGSIRAWHLGMTHDLDAGSAVYLPAGQEHAFAVTTERARVLTVTTPGGFADFVRAAGVPADGAVPEQWEFDVGRIMSAAADNGIDITGPPPSLDRAPSSG